MILFHDLRLFLVYKQTINGIIFLKISFLSLLNVKINKIHYVKVLLYQTILPLTTLSDIHLNYHQLSSCLHFLKLFFTAEYPDKKVQKLKNSLLHLSGCFKHYLYLTLQKHLLLLKLKVTFNILNNFEKKNHVNSEHTKSL